MNTAVNSGSESRPSSLTALVLLAVLTQPLLASSVVLHGFDPVKSWTLSIGVILLASRALWRGELDFQVLHADGVRRTAWILVAVAFAAVTLGFALANGSHWTALLGGNARRQGWLTEVTELLVFASALVACATRNFSLRDLAVGIVIVGAGVSASAICQSHWVNFLDPTPWSAEISNRVAGVMGSASQLATYLAVLVPVTLAVLMNGIAAKQRNMVIASSVSLALQIVALALCRGRAGTVGAVAGSLTLILGLTVHSRAARFLRISILVGLLSSIGLLVALNVPGSPLTFLTRGGSPVAHWLDRLSQLTNFESGTGRVRGELAESLTRSLANRPAAWAFGFGPDLAWDALDSNDSLERKRIEGYFTSADRPHQFGAEKLMSGGIPYLLAWLGMLTLAACRRIAFPFGGGRQDLRHRVVWCTPWVGSAIALFAWIAFSPKPGFACAVATFVAAILTVVLLTWSAFSNSRKGSGDTRNAPFERLELAFVGALVAHLFAGSFSVSMPPERTLTLAIAGCLLGIPRSIDTAESQKRSTSLDAGALGWLVGASCCALVPYYAYRAFSSGASRPQYAAAVVPLTIAMTAILLCTVDRKKFLVHWVIAGSIGLAILTVCAVTGGGPWLETPEQNIAVGLLTPLVTGWIVVVYVFASWRDGVPGGGHSPGFQLSSPRDSSARPTASVGSPVLSALTLSIGLLASWIAIAEFRSDTAMMGAIQLNNQARQLDEQAAFRETTASRRDAVRARAVDVNTRALKLIEEARSMGAPLARFGCPPPLDRVIASERP